MKKNFWVGLESVMGAIAAIAIVIVSVTIMYPESKDEKGNSSIQTNNMNEMKAIGYDYFKENNLPEKIGETKRVSLSEVIEGATTVNITDTWGRNCDVSSSYIEVTRVSDYANDMKVFLVCEGKSEYVTAIIYDDTCKDCGMGADDYYVNNNATNLNNTDYNNNYNTNNNYNYDYDYDNEYEYEDYNSKNYNVYFNTKGGSSIGYQTIKHGQTATYVVPTRPGYVFKGWYLDKTLYDFNWEVTKDITLTAKWEEVGNKNVVINYNTNGGTVIKSDVIRRGTRVTRPTNPTKDCYYFAGWYTTNNFTKLYNFYEPVEQDITLYAKWEKSGYCNNSHYVIFDTKGGTYIDAVEVEYGQRVERPRTPEKEGYTFNGWYLNGVEYNFNTKIYENIVLEAKWTRKNNYNNNTSVGTKNYITFNSNGGSSVATQEVIDGNRAFNPGAPTKNGHTFIGWYYENQKFDFNTRIYNHMVLEARWVPNAYSNNKYCKVVNERVYSTGFAGKSDINGLNSLNYSYTLSFNKSNITNLKLVNYGNLPYSTTEYMNAYNYLTGNYNYNGYNKPISIVNNNSGVDPINYVNLMKHSLKDGNMRSTVTYRYNSGNNYYFDVNISLYNLYNVNNASKFYTSSDYYVYFVPVYFDVQYTDLNSCVNVNNTNEYQYRNNNNYVLVNY